MTKQAATRQLNDALRAPSGVNLTGKWNVPAGLRPLAVALACAVIVTGCGGGGKSSDSSSTGTTTPSATTSNAAPAITTQPQSQSTPQGQNATFSVAAVGTTLTYQWQESADGQTWQNIAGATSDSYTVTNAAPALNGTFYRVAVASGGSSVYSAIVTLTIGTSAASTVSVQPGSSVKSGGSVTFSVPTSGAAQSFQWQSSADQGTTWTNIADANAAEYVIAVVQLAMSGLLYRVQITEDGTTTTSNTITLAVSCPPLQSRLGGQAVYDACLNVTWLVNANLPATLPLGISGIQSDGSMYWPTAASWIQALNATAYLGFSDWRLPVVRPINGTAFVGSATTQQQNTGQIDLGYNISAPGTLYAGSTATELPFLFYNELQGQGIYSVTGSSQAAQLPGGGTPFQNISLTNRYWTGTAYSTNGAYAFDFAHGDQHAYVATSGAGGWMFNVMVLRTGDVGGN